MSHRKDGATLGTVRRSSVRTQVVSLDLLIKLVLFVDSHPCELPEKEEVG